MRILNENDGVLACVLFLFQFDSMISDPAAPRPDFAPPARGRAAVSNAAGRFDLAREAQSDGWDSDAGAEKARVPTQVTSEAARSAITRNTSPDVPFDRSVNPYRGCEHGCIYCFARPSHSYMGLSAGLDFETRLIMRPNIAQVLEKELRAKRYRAAPIAMGTNTDPYQPVERTAELTRNVIDVLARFNHPLALVTKGNLIERDIDLLAPMAERGLVRVGISVTTLDADLSRKMEPRAPAPERRLRMIENLSKAGIPVRVMLAPVIPGLTDCDIEAILTRAREAGASSASRILLRLPREVAALWAEWLGVHFPDRAQRIMGLVRELHGGRDYDPRFGHRMEGQGVHADLLAQRFRLFVKRLGYQTQEPALRSDLFAVPSGLGDQLSLF